MQSRADLFQENGILIEKVEPTQTFEMMWTTLVVIDPTKEVPMQAWIDHIRQGIQSVGSKVSTQDQETWRALFDILDLQQPVVGANHSHPVHPLPKQRRRIKRGLLTVVGEVSKSLFGTATRKYVQEHRFTIDDLQRHQKALDRQVMDFNDDLTKLSYQVSKLLLARSIGRVIEELTMVHDSYCTQLAMFKTQRYELELGWLTEDTPSLSDLID